MALSGHSQFFLQEILNNIKVTAQKKTLLFKQNCNY